MVLILKFIYILIMLYSMLYHVIPSGVPPRVGYSGVNDMKEVRYKVVYMLNVLVYMSTVLGQVCIPIGLAGGDKHIF